MSHGPSDVDSVRSPARSPWLWVGLAALVLAVGIGVVALNSASNEESGSTAEPVIESDQPTSGATDEDTSEDEGASADEGSDVTTVLAKGSFVNEMYKVQGRAAISETVDGKSLALSQFTSEGGPALRVYLVAPGDKFKDGVDLGDLKDKQGDQEYEVPSSIAASELSGSTVVIWCAKFSLPFGSAALS